MPRIGNARTIFDIEYVIDPPSIGSDVTVWTAHGVNCSRDRHRYSGPAYNFTVDILNLRNETTPRQRWHVVIISEVWQFAGAKSASRGTKSLRVIEGKTSEILSWARRCREEKLAKMTERK